MTSPGGDQARRHECEICGSATAVLELRGGARVDRCTRCGHVHRNVTDAHANARSAAYGGDPAMDAVRTRLTYGWVRPNGTHPASVFEIGYGNGGLLRRFHDDGASISGVDPDQLAVGLDPVVADNATLWHGEIESVPDGAVAADLVVGVHVIEHVVDPVVTLRKARSLLNDSGTLVLLTPAGDSWGLRTFGSSWWMLEDPTHVRFFTEASLTQLAVDAGFVDVTVERLVLDSISVDVASAVRRWRPPGPAGALASATVRRAALVTAPLVVGLRALAPRTRPTLRLTARRGRR